MAFPWMALIGMGLGALQNRQNEQREEQDRRVAAETTRMSPWTGMQAKDIREANPWATIGAGGVKGYEMNQAQERSAMDADLTRAQTDYFKAAAQPESSQVNIPAGTPMSLQEGPVAPQYQNMVAPPSQPGDPQAAQMNWMELMRRQQMGLS